MKIIVLGNQAKAMSNFWSVLIRHMRRAGHEVVCCASPGTPTPRRRWQLKAHVRHYLLDRKGLNPLSDLRTTLELFKLFKDEKSQTCSLLLLSSRSFMAAWRRQSRRHTPYLRHHYRPWLRL